MTRFDGGRNDLEAPEVRGLAASETDAKVGGVIAAALAIVALVWAILSAFGL